MGKNNIVERICNINSKLWHKNNKNIDDKHIVLVDLMVEHPTYIMSSCIIAKSIESSKKKQIVGILNSKRSNYIKLINSYGIKNTFNTKRERFKLKIIIKTTALFVYYLFKILITRNILDLNYLEIQFGDLLYDSILRKYGFATIKRIDQKLLFQLFVGVSLIIFWDDYFRKNKVDYLIAGHTVYLQYGIPMRIALKYKAQVIAKRAGEYLYAYKYNEIKESNYSDISIDKMYFKYILNKIELKKKVIPEIHDYYNRRLGGKLIDHDVLAAYKDKILIGENEFRRLLKITNDNPIVVIFNHAYQDAPHGFKLYFNKDYYEWFIDTLHIIKEIKYINWVIKEHPSLKYYNSNINGLKIIREQKINTDHIFIAPDNISTSSFYNFTKGIVTCNGTSALEFSSFGIPSIVCGDRYEELEFTFEAKTKIKYEQLLSSINKLSLSNEQVEKASVASYIYFIYLGKKFNFYPDAPSLGLDENKYFEQLEKFLENNQFDNSEFMIDFTSLGKFLESEDKYLHKT